VCGLCAESRKAGPGCAQNLESRAPSYVRAGSAPPPLANYDTRQHRATLRASSAPLPFFAAAFRLSS